MKRRVLLASAASVLFVFAACAQTQTQSKADNADSTQANTDSQTHAFLNNGVLPDVGPFAPGDANMPSLSTRDTNCVSITSTWWFPAYMQPVFVDPRATTNGKDPYTLDVRATTNGKMPYTAHMRSTARAASNGSNPLSAQTTSATARMGAIAQAPASATVAPGH